MEREHGYYSYKLNKPFKTLEELNAEEGKLIAKEKQEQKLKEDRAKDAEEIEQLMKSVRNCPKRSIKRSISLWRSTRRIITH